MAIQKETIDRAIEIARGFGATRLILFGSAATAPETAKDIDFACGGVDGWRLFELGARLEEELQVHLDIIPLDPPTRFTHVIERRGKVLI